MKKIPKTATKSHKKPQKTTKKPEKNKKKKQSHKKNKVCATIFHADVIKSGFL